EVIYPSGAVARQVLDAAWGSPKRGDSPFSWQVWTNPEHSIRAVLMPGDHDQPDRLRLLPFRPPPGLPPARGELAWAGKHLLDCTAGELTPLVTQTIDDDLQVLPVELSGGYLPLHIQLKDNNVARYTLGIDFTYDWPIRDQVFAALTKHFGPA